MSPCQTGILIMALDQRSAVQTVWAVLLTAMGVLLCLKTPYALRQAPASGFLSFARYFIGAFLIVGGIKKLYRLYLSKPKESPPEK